MGLAGLCRGCSTAPRPGLHTPASLKGRTPTSGAPLLPCRRASKLRRREMEELHKSRAPKPALRKHEQEVIAALAMVRGCVRRDACAL